MTPNNLEKLARLIHQEREFLLTHWRNQVRELPSAKDLSTPTLNDHIPELLLEIARALRLKSETTISEALIEGTPPEHGRQRLKDGFDIEEVVAEYNILRGCIHDLADRNDLSLQGNSFHIVNRVLDQAIGLAVQTFAAQQALQVKKRREEYLQFVAHDLRTPLNAIFLSTRILLADPKNGENPMATKMLNTLLRNAQRLDALVAKVIEENVSVESNDGVHLQRRQFDLWPLVESLIQDLQAVATTSKTVLKNEVPDDLVVYADASLIRRVLQNLIANAIAHSPNGAVVISASEATVDGSAFVSVRDNGAGIPAEMLDKVFDKYESDGQSHGSGLGLTIVKTFVEAHGGTVSVQSQPGAGAEFQITLPGKTATDSGRMELPGSAPKA